MRIKEYQEQANSTDQLTNTLDPRSELTPILGMVGRVGALSTDYMRHLRDGAAYTPFRDVVGEALGDILWYIANIAQKNQINLEDVAEDNIKKNKLRWTKKYNNPDGYPDFDSTFPIPEQLPHDFEIHIKSSKEGSAILQYNDQPFGNPLADNSPIDDGYRFHDVFHLAFVAHLGWSPVLRGNLFFNCKRKSSDSTDEIEDGGRSAVIEEAVSAIIFNEAKKLTQYDGVNYVSKSVLQLIAQLTSHLEVKECTPAQWERAILNAFTVWRKIRNTPTGLIIGSRKNRSLEFTESC